MTRNYLDILAETIRNNWDLPALTDFYLTEDGKAQDTSRGNHYTYGEMYCEMMRLCELFRAIGLKRGDHIAICGSNSANWAVAYLAIAAYQGVVVTVLHSQSTEDIAHQIDFSDAVALFTDRKLWQELKPVHPLSTLTHVIALDDFLMLQGQLLTPWQFTEVKKEEYQRENISISHGKPDDLAVICFTSGSTGNPKGVMLSNKNINSNLSLLLNEFLECPLINSISFLPLAHAGVFVSDIIHLLCRCANIYILSSIPPDKLFICYKIIKPQEIVMVPALLSKFLNSFGSITSKDLHIQINKSLGGEFEMFCLGGAKIPSEIEDTLEKANIKYAIGYGTTECAPFISLEMPSYKKKGTVGKISFTLSACIADTGEILVRGDNVMLGYYKDPEATARKIDKDGWLHTGDRGHLDEDGYLYVEGRMEQDMIVLPNGENIHPEDIESKLNAMPEVKESLVLARDGRLVAIVVPQYTLHHTPYTDAAALRRNILRTINPQLPLYSQLYDVEITDIPLQRTEKQTIKRYLYS